MSKRNNLFHFATSELSQDAFLGWLLSFAMKEHGQEDAALTQCARALLKKMYKGMKPDESVTSVELQKDNIDVLVTMGDHSIIIEGSYILEVSSPGLDRQLKKPRDFVREQGKKVDVTLYAPVDGTKEFTGVLEGYDEDAKTVTIDGKAWPLEKISVIRLHIDF